MKQGGDMNEDDGAGCLLAEGRHGFLNGLPDPSMDVLEGAAVTLKSDASPDSCPRGFLH